MYIKIDRLLSNEKALFLAMDQGLEHGPKDFNIKTIDPYYVLDIAVKGSYNAIILHKGIAEKYYEQTSHKIPLIVKLNGKTVFSKLDPFGAQTCSVRKAVELNASAVGYTIYDGSPLEPKIFKEFSSLQEQAHDYGIPIIAWAYPRGNKVDELSTDNLAYAARVALELGADIIKVKYNGDAEGFKWLVKCAGKAKVVVAGGSKKGEMEFLKEAKAYLSSAGCILLIFSSATGKEKVGSLMDEYGYKAEMLESIHIFFEDISCYRLANG